MAQTGEDCYFYYYSTCNKGQSCPFRHAEEARGNEVECPLWKQGQCFQIGCPYRHMDLKQNRQVRKCYWESQPGGCTKPYCPFLHVQPKNLNLPPPPFTGPQPVRPQVSGPQPVPGMGPPPVLVEQVGGPPPVRHPGQPGHLPPHVWRGPPPHPPPPFQTFPPGPRPVPVIPGPGGPRLIMVPTVEPVVVNINSEESDTDGSPVKPIRSVAPSIRKSQSDTSLIHQEVPPMPRTEHNPLDYFLGAKPWVDPNLPPRDESRSESPEERQFSPIRFQGRRNGSLSPASRGSASPDRDRRRSTSEERPTRVINRRRSHSLDRSRSQSPDWRNRPRGRSPVRPRSRSPIRRRPSPVGHRPFRGRFGMRRSPPRRPDRNLQRPQDRRRLSPEKKVPAHEVIIPVGPKIISTKKEKKEEEKKEEETEKKEEDEKNEEESGEVPVTEVRSLEDIYREKALKSLMEAKKKKIIENRRQKLAERAKKVIEEHPELVKPDKSEEKSEESDDGKEKEQQAESESESESSEEGKETDQEESEAESEEAESEEEEKTESEEEQKADSDIDLADDVDIEIEAGEKENGVGNESNDHSGSEEQKTDSSEKEEEKVVEKRKKSAKPSIKSRLGMKSDVRTSKRPEIQKRAAPKRAIKDRLGSSAATAPKVSVKDRLGKREDVNIEKPTVRSGVIRLNHAKPREIPESLTSVRVNRMDRADYYGKEKDIMMVPKIVVRNRLEDYDEHSRESSRSWHGYDDYDNSESDYDHDTDSEDEIKAKLAKRKKKLKKMLESENSDYDEIELLRREKKKIKKLLKEKKRREKRERRRKESKKREKKRRDYAEDDVSDDDLERNRRKIKIQSRLGPPKNESERSEEEEEEIEEEAEMPEKTDVRHEESEEDESKKTEEIQEVSEAQTKSREEIRKEKARKLQEALQPKTLDQIRRERAVKRGLEPQGTLEAKVKKPEGSGRRILLAEEKEPSPEPLVKVTFRGEVKPPVRQRIRLKRDTEQNENRIPADNTNKAFKRERQIYMPPALKRTDGPIDVDKDTEEAIKRAAAGPTGRDIVDYGEMFPAKKPKPAPEVTPEVPSATAEPVRRFERRPPKVEVENAGIKSFAEIMAEKKRKRLLAQQENKKNITPVVFDDKPDSGPQIRSITPDLKARLSPVEESTSVQNPQSKLSQNSQTNMSSVGAKTSAIDSESNSQTIRTSSPISSSVSIKRTIKPTNVVSKDLSTQKPNRWKRRKPNVDNEDSNSSVPDTKTIKAVEQADTVSEAQKEVEDLSVSPIKSEKDRKPSTEKKSTKASDSLLDFEDELLADVDLNLDDNKSHDELMREMEELLA